MMEREYVLSIGLSTDEGGEVFILFELRNNRTIIVRDSTCDRCCVVD